MGGDGRLVSGGSSFCLFILCISSTVRVVQGISSSFLILLDTILNAVHEESILFCERTLLCNTNTGLFERDECVLQASK